MPFPYFIKKFKNYGYEKGILNNYFVSITQLQDGRIVAGTDRGLVAFDPQNIDSPTVTHPPLITGISIYGKSFSVDSLLL